MNCPQAGLKRVLTLVMLFVSMALKAQPAPEIDSLKQVLTTATGEQKLDLLQQLGKLYRATDLTVSGRYFREGLHEAIQQRNVARQADFLSDIGKVFKASENIDSARWYFNRSLADALRSGNDRAQTISYYELGILLQNEGSLPEALEHYLKGLHAAEAINDQELTGDGYNNIGFVFKGQRDFDQAIEYFRKALAVRERLSDKTKQAGALNNIGLILMEQEKYAEAREYYQRSLALLGPNDSPKFFSMLYNNFGVTYENEGHYAKASEYYLKSIALKEKMNDARGLASTYGNLGAMYRKARQWNLSIMYSNKSLALAERLKAMEYMKTATKNLALVYEAKKDYQHAFNYYRRYKELQDSLFNENKAAQVAGLMSRYDAEKEAHENDLLKKETALKEETVKNQYYLLVCITLGLALVTGIVVALYLRNRKKTELYHILSLQKDEIEKKNGELSDLLHERNSLMNVVAHDLRSPLNKVTGLSELVKLEGPLNDGQRHALGMMNAVADQGRRLITDLLTLNKLENNASPIRLSTFSLSDFLDTIVREFQTAALQKDIRLQWTKPEDPLILDTDKDHLLRVIDNLLSNAIKFSLPGKQVFIEARINQNGIEISVRDEGPGFTEEDRKNIFKKFRRLSAQPTQGEPSTGLGLAIVHELVQQLKGNILLVSEPEKGAEFIIQLPMTKSVGPDGYREQYAVDKQLTVDNE